VKTEHTVTKNFDYLGRKVAVGKKRRFGMDATEKNVFQQIEKKGNLFKGRGRAEGSEAVWVGKRKALGHNCSKKRKGRKLLSAR